MGKPKIMIVVPTLGNIRLELHITLMRWARDKNLNKKYDIIFQEPKVIVPLEAARNVAVKEFIETTNSPEDRLWFIDDDIVPPFHTLDKLVQDDKDIVSATCFVMKLEPNGEYYPYPVSLVYNEERKFVKNYGEGLEQINATAGGCIMIKRKVFESMKRPYESSYFPNGELEMEADLRFCQKAEDNEFEIWYDWDCICDHIKVVSLKGINNLLGSIQNGK